MALLVVLLGLGWLAQTAPPAPKQDQNIPEEDAAVKPKDYTFNPLQAVHELKAGDYYFHRGKLPAAAARYTEATRWNPQNAEAWFKLGLAEEKQDDAKQARMAYEKLISLEPNSKRASEARKHLEQLH
jgi:Flp pilus assembly protein TadD